VAYLIVRKFLFVLLIVIAFAVLWLWRGRDVSMLVDRFYLIETSSLPVKNIAYEGTGTGGILHADVVDLSLNQGELGASPSLGTTIQNQLALSFGGKVFAFGPLSPETDKLATAVPAQDAATILIQHSAIPWRNFFETNFMTGNSPTWKRNVYRTMRWKKPTGEKLEMVWRYEQFFYENNGWSEALMTRPGATGLIRIEIPGASR
jgi:hypothetical protein